MAKDKGILVSPKHGLNPSLAVCFWCGRAMGVALVGRVRKDGDNDAEAPREACFGLEPCSECQKHFEGGVHVVEVTEDGERFNSNTAFAFRTADGKVMWPSGRWAVVRPEALKGGKAGERVLCGQDTMDFLLNRIAKAKAAAEKDAGPSGEERGGDQAPTPPSAATEGAAVARSGQDG